MCVCVCLCVCVCVCVCVCIFQLGKTIHAKQDGVSTAIELHAAEMVPEEGRTSEGGGG